MADIDDAEYEATGDSGASNTYPQQCSALRKNGFVVIKNRPCKIVEMSTSKTGKHGHAKVHLVALDLFTQRKYEDICPSTHNMNVPHVTRKDYQLVNIDDGFMNLLDDNAEAKDDIRVPENDLGKELSEKFDKGDTMIVTILTAMGEEAAIGLKPMT